jgi:hypothetical protein
MQEDKLMMMDGERKISLPDMMARVISTILFVIAFYSIMSL